MGLGPAVALAMHCRELVALAVKRLGLFFLCRAFNVKCSPKRENCHMASTPISSTANSQKPLFACLPITFSSSLVAENLLPQRKLIVSGIH